MRRWIDELSITARVAILTIVLVLVLCAICLSPLVD
jgi:hypothetical protein